jgi:pimeloyl-ACP methyl ester carboxylesterase
MISRRDAIGLLAAMPLTAEALLAAGDGGPEPFHVSIPHATVDHILARVRETRWPDKLEADDWRYGANWDYMKELATYWTSKYDWRKEEAKLNAWPQFRAHVGDFDIHFYHVRGKGPRPVPLVLTHGWPGSVMEFLDAIGPLTDPAKYGGSAADSFDVVVPSLPGFWFSSKAKGKPVGPPTTAKLWHSLMREKLGYAKYGAQGGDWGNAVTIQLARQFPDEMIGIHLNAGGARALPEAQQSEEERAWVKASAAYRAAEMDYFGEHQHKPQTVAFALADNPLGTAAWIVEKFKVWSDSGNNIETAFTKDQLLTDVMMYLVTDTVGSGVAYYRGSAEDGPGARDKTMVPTGFAAFPKEMTALQPPRVMLERDFNLTHYTKMPKGGHFACLEQPALLVQDVRDFFRPLRSQAR